MKYYTIGCKHLAAHFTCIQLLPTPPPCTINKPSRAVVRACSDNRLWALITYEYHSFSCARLTAILALRAQHMGATHSFVGRRGEHPAAITDNGMDTHHRNQRDAHARPHNIMTICIHDKFTFRTVVDGIRAFVHSDSETSLYMSTELRRTLEQANLHESPGFHGGRNGSGAITSLHTLADATTWAHARARLRLSEGHGRRPW
jgi:hypothetical protein